MTNKNISNSNGKDVYILRLGFHGGSDIKVNIPNLYDLPAFWQANLEFLEDRSDKEKLKKQKELGKYGVQIETFNHRFEKYEVLPDKLWLLDWNDRDEPLAHEPIFRIDNGGTVVREPLAKILSQFRLGQTTLTPVQIYDFNTRELWSDEVFYFLNICEKREFVCFPQSHQDFTELNYTVMGRKAYSRTSIIEHDGQVEIHRQALECDVDLWYDLVIGSLFISSELYHALKSIGLKQGDCTSDRFSTSVYKCKLV